MAARHKNDTPPFAPARRSVRLRPPHHGPGFLPAATGISPYRRQVAVRIVMGLLTAARRLTANRLAIEAAVWHS